MNVVVFGAGSLGSLIGGLLAREHDVVLVGRDPHVRVVRRSGLCVDGTVEFTVRPDARTDVPESADLAVVTVEAFDTAVAAHALAGRVDVALSLQNGMGNEAILGREIDRVLAGTCTYGAVLREPGTVECTGRGEVVLGSLDYPCGLERTDDAETGGNGMVETVERVAEAFRDAGVETTVAADMARQLWEKLAVNAGINPVTALAGVRNGALEDGPAHDLAAAAARETARVARESGVELPDERALAALEAVIGTTAANESSMLRDVRSGRRTEIDAVSGFVVDRATSPVPITETLYRLVRTWERERGLH